MKWPKKVCFSFPSTSATGIGRCRTDELFCDERAYRLNGIWMANGTWENVVAMQCSTGWIIMMKMRENEGKWKFEMNLRKIAYHVLHGCPLLASLNKINEIAEVISYTQAELKPTRKCHFSTSKRETVVCENLEIKSKANSANFLEKFPKHEYVIFKFSM